MDEQQDPLETLGEEVATEAPEAETVPEEDAATEDQPRTEDGRFASSEEKSPEGQADEATPETPEVREEADAGAAEKVEPTPFKYRANAADYEIPGATVGTDGIVLIPSDSVPHLTQLLASGRAYSDTRPGVEAAFQQQIQQAQSESDASAQTRAALIEQFEKVVTMTPEDRLNWAEGFAEAWPAIKAQAEQAGAEAGRLADQERLKQYERQEFERTFEPELRQGLSDFILQEQQSNPLFKELTRDDMETLFGKLISGWQNNGLVTTANNLPWNGEPNPKANEVFVRREMEYVASFRRQSNESTKQVTQAKKANEAEMSESKAPPAVKAKTGPPAEGKPVPGFKLPKGVDPASQEATDLFEDWFEALEV